ncbi:hypothetical protein AYI70_g6382 [Smittium culicis]|uniref:Uncharacterized protein n=1 Tax=Smittium culicis TaxID=133412 RepID=A0A1R1XQC7_9FUNG|nr:hypothetical protein AYI70_g6382 [Smittium culicis]
MVIVRPSLLEDISPLSKAKCGLIRVNEEKEGWSLLQLVPRQQVCGAALPSTQLFRMIQHLRMPSLESGWPINSENQNRAPKHNTGHSVMKISYIVTGPSERVGRITISSTSDNGDNRSRKRKIFAIQQQGVVIDGLEDH